MAQIAGGNEDHFMEELNKEELNKEELNKSIERVYAHGMKNQKEDDIAGKVKDAVLKFYDENKDICERAIQYSNAFYNEMPTFISEPVKTERDEFVNIINDKKTILVITANPIEMGVFLHWMYDKHKEIIKSYLVDSNAYNTVNINENQMIIHHHMGETGETCAQIALDTTSRIFQPDYVILLGICYGMDMKKQKLGRVTVSRQVIAFRINFQEDMKGNTYNEVQDEVVGMPQRSFIRKIKQRMMYAQITSIVSTDDEPFTETCDIGTVLSCNSLMSSYRVKKDILLQFKPRKIHPYAGEMEGGGLLRSMLVSEDGFGNWLIIKSICDWGMNKNGLDDDEDVSEEIKDSIQALAMTNSCSALEKILNLLD